ncbi:MAG: hypothetical protein ABI678_12500, partial [Kofleriaceae bacterium]
VASARRGLDPSADVAARVRAKVAHAVGAGAIATTTTSSGAVTFGAGKLAAIVLVVGALAGGGFWFAHARSTAPSLTAPTITEPADTDTPVAIRSASSQAIAAPPAAPALPRMVLPSAIVAAPTITPSAPEVPTPMATRPATPITLAREVQLVDGAIAALRESDLPSALEILAVYDREAAGHGQLAEDAAALTIEARCRSHEPISDQLASFDQHFPHSVQRARITASCGK